jgi:hypothetical protein
MFYASCPTAVVNAPADIVWALLVEPAGWGSVFDMRVAGIDPPGPAIVGQKVCGETGLRIFHLKLWFSMKGIDPDHHRLRLEVKLPFGLTVHEDLGCTPLDDTHRRVDYRCNFDFPTGWRGTLMRVLMKRRLDDGPKDSLSRLKRAAERRFAGRENDGLTEGKETGHDRSISRTSG